MYFLDLLGTFAFAVTGALKAKGKDLHLFGALFLGAITAIGGGTIRDVVINRTPLFYLKDHNYLLIAIFAGLVTYFVPTFFKRWYSFFRLVDTIGLAAFIIIGVSVSYSFLFEGVGPSLISFISCILFGMLTGFGGGIVRDAAMGDLPFAFKKGSNYVTSAFWGAFAFYVLMFQNTALAVTVSFSVTFLLRELNSEFGIYRRVYKAKGSIKTTLKKSQDKI